MAHAHDRTLLARLGFADPDRHDPSHDLACRYLSEPAQREKLLKLSIPDVYETSPVEMERERRWRARDSIYCPVCSATAGSDCRDSAWPYYVHDLRVHKERTALYVAPLRTHVAHRARCEYEIGKGEGKYHTTVGFVDVMVQAWTTVGAPDLNYQPGTAGEAHYLVGVEVKAGKVQWSEVLRQINLYRAYLACHWIAAVLFEPSAEFRSALADHGVKVAFLGTQFESWCRKRVPAQSDLVEI